MRKMAIVSSSALAVLMGGTMMAPAAGAAQISGTHATVSHAPASHHVQTRRVCKRVVTWRHHHRHVKVVCHTVRRHY